MIERKQTAAMTEAEATELRAAVKKAKEASTRSSLALAELLFKVCYGSVRKGGADIDLALAWGHDDFDEFAEHELEIHQTTARSLVVLWEELFERRRYSIDNLPHSMTKLRQLAKVSKKAGTDGRTMNGWVAKAREMSCCEFEAAVDDAFGESKKYRPLGFRVKLSKFPAFMKRVKSARDSFGVQSNGEALSMIVDEWYEQHQKEDRTRKKSA
jgi:hypothetical protein